MVMRISDSGEIPVLHVHGWSSPSAALVEQQDGFSRTDVHEHNVESGFCSAGRQHARVSALGVLIEQHDEVSDFCTSGGQDKDTSAPGVHKHDELAFFLLSMWRVSPSIVLIHQRAKDVFYHAAQVLDLHERKTADTAILLPADEGEFIAGEDTCLFTHVLGEHHLATVIDT
jgi:hypothetical protein